MICSDWVMMYSDRVMLCGDWDWVMIRRGGVGIERSSRMREIGVRSPVATDLSRNNRS